MELRVDANGGFTPENAMSRLHALAKYDIHSIEQPIKQHQWRKMAQICAASPIPVALDEELIGVYSLADKVTLLETIRPAYLVLKPTLHGGFQGCEEWIGLASERGIGWWITSALESNVGLNAIAQWTAYQLQRSVKSSQTMFQGLGTGQLFTDNIPVSQLQMRGDELWFIPSPDRWDKKLFASAEDRLNMLDLVIGDDPRIAVSEMELQMEDYRGSYVTMSLLREKYPDVNLRLLVGADSYVGIPHWRDPLHFYGTEFNGPQLLKEFELIVFERRGTPMPDPQEHKVNAVCLHLIPVHGSVVFGNINSGAVGVGAGIGVDHSSVFQYKCGLAIVVVQMGRTGNKQLGRGRGCQVSDCRFGPPVYGQQNTYDYKDADGYQQIPSAPSG